MTRLESRKLLSLSAVAAMHPQTTTYPAPEQQIDVTAGMRNVHELAAAVTEAEGFAYSSLNTSLEIAEGLLDPEHVCVISVNHAMQYLVEPPQVPSQAMEALNAVSRAVAFCPDSELRTSLERSKQAIRDALVWRVQARVPWGSRPAFIAELEQANGAPLDKTLLSQCLNSHSLVVCKRFPFAFLSKAKWKEKRHGAVARPAKSHRKTDEVQMMRPPGLEIVDVASTASRDTLITGGKRHAPKLDAGLSTILHSSYSLTQYSALSTPAPSPSPIQKAKCIELMTVGTQTMTVGTQTG